MKTKRISVEEGTRLNIGSFPNFDAKRSIREMKDKYYGKDAMLVKCGSYIYSVSKNIYDEAV